MLNDKALPTELRENGTKNTTLRGSSTAIGRPDCVVGFVSLLWVMAHSCASNVQGTDQSGVQILTDESGRWAADQSTVFTTKEQATNEFEGLATDESKVQATDKSGVHVTNKPKVATEVLNVRYLSIELATITNWFKLGINLSIPKHELDKIERDFQGNDRQMLEMLDRWLQRTPNAALEDLVRALEQMGEKRVAKNICQKYTLGENKLYKALVRQHEF